MAAPLPQGVLPLISPLPVGSLPGIPTANPYQSPVGGDAASLFPTLAPKPAPGVAKKARTSPVADTSALPEGASVAGGQVAGLAALALAFILAIARLSVRHRRPPAKPSQETSKKTGTKTGTETSSKTGGESAGKPDPATTDKPADEQDAKDSADTEEAAPETPPTPKDTDTDGE